MVLLNCLIRMAEFHACSSLSVCLILWDRNVVYISSTSHCVLYVSVSLSHSLTLCFSILCIGLSLWACVHAHVQICEYVLYVFISLHNLAVCVFLLRIYLPNSFQVMCVLGLVVPTLNSIAFWLCGHNCSYICIPWADYKSVVMSGLISRIMCNICLYSISYPGFRIPFMKTGELTSQVSGGQWPVA